MKDVRRAVGHSYFHSWGLFMTGGFDDKDELVKTSTETTDGSSFVEGVFTGIAGHCSVVLDEDHVVVLGGSDGKTAFGSVYMLDRSKGLWVRLEDMPTPRTAAACGVSRTPDNEDKEIVVVGGNC